MRIEYLSDKLWLEVTPCIVPVMPGLALRVGGIGAAPDYGEGALKSFTLAHKRAAFCGLLMRFSYETDLYIWIAKGVFYETIKSKKVLALFLIISLCLSLSISAAAAETKAVLKTESEPNKTITTANVVNQDDTIYGTIGSTTDVDFFRVSFPLAGTANFWLGDIPSGKDYDLKNDFQKNSKSWVTPNFVWPCMWKF